MADGVIAGPNRQRRSKRPPRQAKAETPEKGLPPAAPTIFNIGPFPVNQFHAGDVDRGPARHRLRPITRPRKMKDVPDGAQNFWEFLVESLH